MSERRCLVALCHNGPVVFQETARSLMELGWGNRVERAKQAHGFTAIDHYWSRSFPRVDSMRDSVMTLAQAEGFSHVLFLDADMVWPSDTLERMLAHHDKGIVGGLYVMRHPPYAPVALVDGHIPDGSTVTQYGYAHDAVYNSAVDLIPVDVVGMGCTLIPVSVLEQIGPRPWFHYQDDAQGWPSVTEDVPFCQKAKAAGVAIWLDPTVSCGHVDTLIRDRRFHQRWLASQKATESAMTVNVREVSPYVEASV